MKAKTTQDSLHTLSPLLCRQLHPSKNLPLTPADVKPGSHKKVWWRCEKGHEWQAQIRSRALGKAGCPFCSGRRFLPAKSLWRMNRTLSYQWHPTRNGTLRPKDISASSDQKVWWQCKKGHEWKATVGSRHRDGNGCPYCAGRKACKDNSLASKRPDLAEQWHKTKNKSLSPHDVTPGSNRTVWWKCLSTVHMGDPEAFDELEDDEGGDGEEKGTLTISLNIDPDDELAQDDTFTLFSTGNQKKYKQIKTVKNDAEKTSGSLELTFTGLYKNYNYSLEADPGGSGKKEYIFTDRPFGKWFS